MSGEMPGDEPTKRQWIGFWSMIVQQTQNAFNDKAAQFILIPLGGAVGFAVESPAGLMIALPFVLFAPLAGWLSDRFSKRDVMLGSAILQLCVFAWICGAVVMRNLPLAMCGFFALAVQSAFFSPAKIGINKELVGSRHLGFAAGIQQMMAMLAILAGQIVSGWYFDVRYTALGGTPDLAWQAALVPLLVVTALSVPAVFMAWIIPRVPAQGHAPFTRSLAVSHFRDLRELWRGRGLRMASFGVAFFWGFAAFINLWSVKLAKELTGGGEGFGTMSSVFMAAASLGMALGFGTASWLLRRRIELGWVPLGGLAMSATATGLAFVAPGGWPFLTGLGLLAFSAAVFLAPLNAWMQDNYPPDRRGELQSAVNLQDCLAGILAVGLIALFEVAARLAGVSAAAGFRIQLVFVGLCCALVTLMIIRMLPGDFLRLLLLGMVRSVYRIRVAHGERVPARGGALLLPNHVTYADAFFLSAACPRPVRFVMDDTFMASRAIRWSAGIFDTVPIRRDQPLEAIRATIEALKAGHVVCLFPEGQLTRTGMLCELRRGFELIAKKAGHPLIPVWCDGAWGSVFSFERGRFFRKLPYQVPYGLSVAFGREIPAQEVDRATVRAALQRAAVTAVGRRFFTPGWGLRMPRAAGPATALMKSCGEYARRRFWVNGHQIGQVGALQRRRPFHVPADDPLRAELPGLFLTFPELFGAKEIPCESPLEKSSGQWVGGAHCREFLRSLQSAGGMVFYDFSPDALKPLELEGVVHCPCLAVDGMVIAMSMPDPPLPNPQSEPQPGSKAGSWGKPLPGWLLTEDADGRLRAYGPAAPGSGLPLPDGCFQDDAGFLCAGHSTKKLV
jgi:acyl-[acyl-carrier-protein]-phospholipid O-acyltransferase / long-chain-fatty-acid--[acyl-carrier-protein] ligase